MDYLSFVRNYHDVTRLPIDLLQGAKPVWSSLNQVLNTEETYKEDLFPMDHNPSFCSLSDEFDYGRIHVEDTDYDIIVGPAFGVPVTQNLIRSFMHALMLPAGLSDQVFDFFSAAPIVTHEQLRRHMQLIFHAVNGHPVTSDNIYITDDYLNARKEASSARQYLQTMEEASFHNTYFYELQLYEKIKSGNTDALKVFLETTPIPASGQIVLAATPLRSARNSFITTATKAGFLGAIPGGVDVEKAYQLTEYYIREMEKLSSIEAIGNLTYAMLMDFCERAGQTKAPEGISSDVYTCMNYVRTHTNEKLSVEDVAAVVHRSSSYIMKKFREELGIHVGAYITRCKLEEAKSMLIFSDYSLSEISSYLCFSSQSYFQNLFRKQYGMTPAAYRKKGRTL